MDDVLERLAKLETAHRRMTRSLRFWRATALGVLILSLSGSAMAASGGVQEDPVIRSILNVLHKLQRRVSTLEDIVEGHHGVVGLFTRGTPIAGADGTLALDTTFSGDVTFTGNLYIVNGLGSTTTTNASGNLIVGYNETGNLHGDARTGSHNIVVGAQQSFSSYGGAGGGTGQHDQRNVCLGHRRQRQHRQRCLCLGQRRVQQLGHRQLRARRRRAGQHREQRPRLGRWREGEHSECLVGVGHRRAREQGQRQRCDGQWRGGSKRDREQQLGRRRSVRVPLRLCLRTRHSRHSRRSCPPACLPHYSARCTRSNSSVWEGWRRA